MSEIQVGDIVQLISGSPRMTVYGISKGRAAVVWCHYMTGVVRTQRISLKALVKSSSYVRRAKSYSRGPDLDTFDDNFSGFEDHEFQR